MKNILLVMSLLFATTTHAAFFGIEEQILRDTVLIENGGFENGKSRWTASGSSVFTIVTSGANFSGIGSASASWDATAASETLTSKQQTVPDGLFGDRCFKSFMYKGGDTNITARIIDGTLAVVASDVLAASTGWSTRTIEFSCPNSGTFAVSLIAGADAAIIYLDKFFLGEAPDRGVAANPIKYDKTRSIGTVGSVANVQGPLVDGDFVTIGTSAYYDLNNNGNKTGGTLGDAVLAKHDTTDPVFTKKGLFGNENQVTFTSANDDRLTSTDAFFNPGDSTDWSMNTWVYFDNWQTTDNRYIAAQWSSTASADAGWYIANIGTTGDIELSYGVGAAVVTIGSVPTKNLSGSHHMAITYDSAGNVARAYFDGQLIGSNTGIADTSTSDRLLLGGLDDASDTFDCDCSLQDFSFESRKLSDSEVNARYSKRYTNDHQIAGGHVLTNSSFPFDSLTDKVSYWNLTDLTDGSGNAKTLTNNGVAFTDLDIFGITGVAEFDGASSLKISDAYFNPPVSTNRTFGGLFKQTGSATEMLMSNDFNGVLANAPWELKSQSGKLVMVVNNVTALEKEFADISPGEWFHVAVSYNAATTVWNLYKNGVKEDTMTKAVVQGGGGDLFQVGARFDASSTFFTGSAQDVFYGNTLLTDEDIAKLAAAKITTALTVPVKSQDWAKSLWGREDGKINNQLIPDWVLDTSATAVYLNTGLESGSEINLKLIDNSFSAQTVATSTYNSGELSAAPSFPINHGLPGRPQHIVVMTEGQVTAGDWGERHDLCEANDTELKCDLSSLTIDGSHNFQIIASMTPSGTAVATASASELGLVRSVTPDIVNADDTTAGLVSGENDIAEGALTGVTWNGTAPTTSVSERFKCIKVGKRVDIWVRATYGVAGSANTRVFMNLPATCPTPASMSNATLGGSSEVLASGSGQILDAIIQHGTASENTFLEWSGSSYRIFIFNASVTGEGFSGHISYWVN